MLCIWRGRRPCHTPGRTAEAIGGQSCFFVRVAYISALGPVVGVGLGFRHRRDHPLRRVLLSPCVFFRVYVFGLDGVSARFSSATARLLYPLRKRDEGVGDQYTEEVMDRRREDKRSSGPIVPIASSFVPTQSFSTGMDLESEEVTVGERASCILLGAGPGQSILEEKHDGGGLVSQCMRCDGWGFTASALRLCVCSGSAQKRPQFVLLCLCLWVCMCAWEGGGMDSPSPG